MRPHRCKKKDANCSSMADSEVIGAAGDALVAEEARGRGGSRRARRSLRAARGPQIGFQSIIYMYILTKGGIRLQAKKKLTALL